MGNNSLMGTGTTIVFVFAAPNQALSFAAKYRQIGGVPRSVPVLDDTVLSSTGYMEKRPGDLKDLDPIDCEIFADVDKEIPLGLVATITITYPPKPGGSAGAVFTASGFISQESGAAATPGAQLQGTFQLQLDGKTTKPTWTAGTGGSL